MQKRTAIIPATFLVSGCLVGAYVYREGRKPAPLPVQSVVLQDIPSRMAEWPWPNARTESLHRGVRHWFASSADGTALDLLEFDFAANPNLRLELFDQDQADAEPFDNRTKFWRQGVGQITRRLNATGHGKIIAAWNGLFFGFDRQGDEGTAEHVAPVVLNGTPHYNFGNHRWTFGVKYRDGKPAFRTMHMPNRAALTANFDFAAGAAQCLIRDGSPLALRPLPRPGEAFLKGPVPSTPQEAGHIPIVDHMKTSRVSWGWSRDNRHLYLLFVKEPGNETESALLFKHGLPARGGWSLADLQRFWTAKRVWGAVNSDGGGVAQLAYLRSDGNYMLIPANWAVGNRRMIVSPKFEGAPAGGSLMYFYVCDRSFP